MKYWRRPLDIDQIKVPHGAVRILIERCKGCGFCIEYCPKDVLVMSEEFNRKGYHVPRAVREGECVNCNLCEMICPDFAYSRAVTETDEPSPRTETAGEVLSSAQEGRANREG
jgi:2-oxoglutarate ferredoxin oxidoreductase subunit delta